MTQSAQGPAAALPGYYRGDRRHGQDLLEKVEMKMPVTITL
jgi:hypothetical protein